MQQRLNTPDTHSSLKKRRIALALQGGGSHGAFTWGVLDRLLEEPSFEIVGISGTSAGAMNAGILADGLHRGGASQARLGLRHYWQDVGHLPAYASLWPLAAQRTWHLDNNPAFLWADMLTRIWSPYQLNPTNYQPAARAACAHRLRRVARRSAGTSRLHLRDERPHRAASRVPQRRTIG